MSGGEYHPWRYYRTPRWHRLEIACYDKEAAKTAQLMDKDPDDTSDVWLSVMIDLNNVIAVRASYNDEIGTWLHLSNGERMRVNLDFQKACELLCP